MMGRSLSHYLVTEKLGEGGMGVVYKARDTRLDRVVALKVLPSDKTMDTDRRRRFVQEAKAASALSHPNIITIYEIDAYEGTDFIAMEYIAGRTLDRHIPRQGMRTTEVLRYAVQMADALAAAHAAGIIHRDLKPGNIMVADSGLVKVLDFGLAKLTEKTATGEDGATATLGDKPNTEEGHILGTIAYMSPEQAQGLRLDARSDIFSLGAVLYEMLTGQRAFSGDTKVSTMAAILNRDPQPLAETTPRELDRIVTRCLRKDPARRFQNMADLKVALEELKEESDTGQLTAPAALAPRPRWQFVAAALAVVAVLAAGVWWRWNLRSAPGSSANRNLRQLTHDSGPTSFPALSPDAKLVAYQSDRAEPGRIDIWIQQTSGGAAIPLTKGPAIHQHPVFSGDGAKVYFDSTGPPQGIYEVSSLGGEARLIAAGGILPAVSPDGQSITYIGMPSRQLLVVPPSGGEPRDLVPGYLTLNNHRPVWSPDSQRVAFIGQKIGDPLVEVWLAPVSGGKPKKTNSAAWSREHKYDGSPSAWLPGDGVIAWLAKDQNIQIYRFHLNPDWLVAGEPEPLTFGGTANMFPSVAAGKMVFQSGENQGTLWSLAADTNRGLVTGVLEKLAGYARNPSSTLDGKTLVYSSNRTGSSDIFFRDLATGRERAVTVNTTERSIIGSPQFDRAGTEVVYTLLSVDGYFSVYAVPVVGGAQRNICQDCGGSTISLHPDGKQFLARRNDGARSHVNLVDMETGKSVLLLQHSQFPIAAPMFSPDGKWIAFLLARGADSSDVEVAPFRGANTVPEQDWITVTPAPGNVQQPIWSPDSGLVYYAMRAGGSYSLMAQRLDRSRHPLGASFRVYEFPGRIPPNAAVNLAVLPGSFVAVLPELKSNIWMMDLPK
jgi:eukaryotic-like serine/threonine-protein kinase